MAFAEALHHSAGQSKKKVVERRERHEEEAETHPTGTADSISGDAAGSPVGAQVTLEAAAGVLVADGLPTFALPVLAESAGEALSFVLQQQLAPVEEEEEAQVEVDVPESVEWLQLSNTKGKIKTLEQAYSCDLLEPS